MEARHEAVGSRTPRKNKEWGSLAQRTATLGKGMMAGGMMAGGSTLGKGKKRQGAVA